MANSHVELIGVESQSIGNAKHQLNAHVIPLEGLDLSNVKSGEYILSAFSLNLKDSDGSPVRAVLHDKK